MALSSSPRTRGPIRRGLSFGTCVDGFRFILRRWLWVPASAGTTTRISGAPSHSRAANCLRVIAEHCPPTNRGRRECRAPKRARSLACKSKKARKQVTAGRRSVPAFPARLVLTAYSTLSPAIGLVVTAGVMRKHYRQTPASRRQDHVASPSAAGAPVMCAIASTASSANVK